MLHHGKTQTLLFQRLPFTPTQTSKFQWQWASSWIDQKKAKRQILLFHLDGTVKSRKKWNKKWWRFFCWESPRCSRIIINWKRPLSPNLNNWEKSTHNLFPWWEAVSTKHEFPLLISPSLKSCVSSSRSSEAKCSDLISNLLFTFFLKKIHPCFSLDIPSAPHQQQHFQRNNKWCSNAVYFNSLFICVIALRLFYFWDIDVLQDVSFFLFQKKIFKI